MTYDPGDIKRATRSGRQRGAWFYIPWEELHHAGAPDPPAPIHFACYGCRGGRVIIRLTRATPRRALRGPAIPEG